MHLHSRSIFYQTGVQCLLILRAVRQPGSLNRSNGLPRYDYLPCLILVTLSSLHGTNFLPSRSIASSVADPTHWLQGWACDSRRPMHFCWVQLGNRHFFLRVTQLVEGKPDLLMTIWFLEGVSLSENKANTEENRDKKWRVLTTYFWAPDRLWRWRGGSGREELRDPFGLEPFNSPWHIIFSVC